MRLIKFLAVAMLLVLTIALAVAQSPKATFAWEYNFKAKAWSPIVAPVSHTFTEVPILKTVDASLLFGAESGSNRPMIGFMLSRSGKLAREADWVLGATFRVAQQRPPTFGGVVIGATLRLKT